MGERNDEWPTFSAWSLSRNKFDFINKIGIGAG